MTPPTSPNCVCQSFSPWNSWSKPHLNVSSPMPTPTTSTLYRSTATRRHTSLPMTCASTCGIWKSLTRASVSLELCYWCVWCGMEQISKLIAVCCWIIFPLIILFVREDGNFGFEVVLSFFDSQVLFESFNLIDAGCF